MHRWIARSALALALGLLAGEAKADDVFCAPNLGPVTIDGNVIVTRSCTLTGTIVKGNVIVQRGASLLARRADIEGNVQAEGASAVKLRRTFVGGDVQLFDLRAVGASMIDGSIIGGNIQMEANAGSLVVFENTVEGDVQAFSNRGGVRIDTNVIGGNLQCKSNVPAPIGGWNQVEGNKEDQCRNL